MDKMFRLLRRGGNALLFLLKYAMIRPLQLLRSASSVSYLETAVLYPGYLQKGNGLAFCLEHAKLYCQGKGIDIGAGDWPYPGARAIENTEDENAFSILERDNALDYIFSSHCLEHLNEWRQALLEWVRVCRPGGYIYLYLPHPAAELWHKQKLPFHVWNPTPQIVIEALEKLGCDIVDSSFFPDAYLSFYIVARKG